MPDRPAAAGELALWSDLGADVLAEYRARAPRAAAWAAAAPRARAPAATSAASLRGTIARGSPELIG